jgi:hypothetical protein
LLVLLVLMLVLLLVLLLGGMLLGRRLLGGGLRLRGGATMRVREEGDDIRCRVVSVVTINDAAAGGVDGLGWRRGIECAVEVLGGGSGTINEVCKREMRPPPIAAGSTRYLSLLLRRLRG